MKVTVKTVPHHDPSFIELWLAREILRELKAGEADEAIVASQENAAADASDTETHADEAQTQ